MIVFRLKTILLPILHSYVVLLHFLTVHVFLIHSVDIVSASNNSAVISGVIGIIIAILLTVIVLMILFCVFVWKRNHNRVIELK